MSGQIVDASLVATCQRNTKAEKADIKAGKISVPVGRDRAPCRQKLRDPKPLRFVQLVQFDPHREPRVSIRKLINQTSLDLGILNVDWS